MLNINRQPVQFSSAVHDDVTLQQSAYRASSRSFWLTVSGAALSRGIVFELHPAGKSAGLAFSMNDFTADSAGLLMVTRRLPPVVAEAGGEFGKGKRS